MTHVKVNSRPNGKSIDNFFDEVFTNFPAIWSTWDKESTGIPPVNIFETKDTFRLELNVPGRKKEDFTINVEKEMLNISFEKKTEEKAEDVKTVRREFDSESFKRSFILNDKIDVNNIQAQYENGILSLHLPKKEEVKPESKQITIQ